MNTTVCLQQVLRKGNLDSNLILRQYKLDLIARLMEIKSMNRRLGEDQLPKELGCSSGTSQRYRQDIKLLSPYRITQKSHKRKQKVSNCEHEPKRLQVTSKDLN